MLQRRRKDSNLLLAFTSSTALWVFTRLKGSCWNLKQRTLGRMTVLSHQPELALLIHCDDANRTTMIYDIYSVLATSRIAEPVDPDSENLPLKSRMRL
jgi:hypothetical protein